MEILIKVINPDHVFITTTSLDKITIHLFFSVKQCSLHLSNSPNNNTAHVQTPPAAYHSMNGVDQQHLQLSHQIDDVCP